MRTRRFHSSRKTLCGFGWSIDGLYASKRSIQQAKRRATSNAGCDEKWNCALRFIHFQFYFVPCNEMKEREARKVARESLRDFTPFAKRHFNGLVAPRVACSRESRRVGSELLCAPRAANKVELITPSNASIYCGGDSRIFTNILSWCEQN